MNNIKTAADQLYIASVTQKLRGAAKVIDEAKIAQQVDEIKKRLGSAKSSRDIFDAFKPLDAMK